MTVKWTTAIGIISVLIVVALLCLVTTREGFIGENALPSVASGVPTRFLDESLWSSKIPNAPAPAGTDINGQLMYSNADVEADVTKIKQELANLNLNIPGMVKMAVSQQVPVSLGAALRDVGYPMTGEVYGQKAFALHSLRDGCLGSGASNAQPVPLHEEDDE
jgi:hypothetical protein